jgi:hypothetical protein
MRILYILVILSLFFCSCNNSKQKKEVTKIQSEAEKLQKMYTRVERNLSYDKEKIILLSLIRKIPFDTLNLIFLEYFVLTDTLSSSDKNSKYQYQSSISKISEKYQISESKIASFVFSYKYEMLTKEDIEESAIENYEQDPPETDER